MLPLVLPALLAAAAAPDTDAPFRLGDVVEGPVDLSVWHRSRFSGIENQFRAGRAGRDLGYSVRTLVAADLTLEWFRATVEVQDARFYGGDDNSPIDAAIVDPLDILEAHVGLGLEGVIAPQDSLRLRVGRLTKEFASRRLLARNIFRNTSNQFDGLDVVYDGPEGARAELFAMRPVTLRPAEPARAKDNELELNTSTFARTFWGASYRTRPLGDLGTVQVYLLGLHEHDERDFATADRQLFTPGLRLLRRAARGALDWELEIDLQFGRTRDVAAADAPQLDHRAFFVHAHVGYTLDTEGRWRAVLRYEYASGDADPTDDVQGRFDDLFGVIRPEYGPTGLYAAFDRQNVTSPALRVQGSIGRVFLRAEYRAVWLAQARDSWRNAQLRDPTGAAGGFIGHQGELFVRVPVLPGNVTVDAGVVGLLRRDTLDGPDPAPPLYGFVDLVLQI